MQRAEQSISCVLRSSGDRDGLQDFARFHPLACYLRTCLQNHAASLCPQPPMPGTAAPIRSPVRLQIWAASPPSSTTTATSTPVTPVAQPCTCNPVPPLIRACSIASPCRALARARAVLFGLSSQWLTRLSARARCPSTLRLSPVAPTNRRKLSIIHGNK